MQEDSRKGDFVYQTNHDREELNIDLNNEEIKNTSYLAWKQYTNNNVKHAALEELNHENSTKEKTKDIKFNELKMSQYIQENERTKTTKVIFSVRSKTLDIKEWLPGNTMTPFVLLVEKIMRPWTILWFVQHMKMNHLKIGNRLMETIMK